MQMSDLEVFPFSQENIGTTDGDCDILNLLFGQDFADFGDVSPPRSESTSSDSDMTPSPATVDDVELSEILSSTSASPGFAQTSEDFTIDLGRYFKYFRLIQLASCKVMWSYHPTHGEHLKVTFS